VGETEHHKRVVVVGAGFGGLNAAKRLSGHGLDILLLDRNNYHIRSGALQFIERGGKTMSMITAKDGTQDLKKMNVPTLIVHGDDDQIVPIAASALRSAKIAPQATLKVYPGAPHGLPITHQDQFNADLLAFIKS